ncbi:MAG: DNA repair protein RadC [Candidatus Eisenbacteria bacterium]|uniref:DNA repair protein RadC n=1 Tax=Eiseniibacteriota bacterium TaxID=2212470 RepID=A0A7Y2EBB5_UNCEI|nr:DNA repair protein RadC [Candidatus Eisenbacteria bacterium]
MGIAEADLNEFLDSGGWSAVTRGTSLEPFRSTLSPGQFLRMQGLSELLRGSDGETLDRPQKVYEELLWLRRRKREHFVALLLDSRKGLLKTEVISVGSLSTTVVHPREVFVPAIVTRSASLVVAHNHPSGNPEPSDDDIRLTRRLVQCGEILGLPIVDHLIIGHRGFFSFREEGLMA